MAGLLGTIGKLGKKEFGKTARNITRLTGNKPINNAMSTALKNAGGDLTKVTGSTASGRQLQHMIQGQRGASGAIARIGQGQDMGQAISGAFSKGGVAGAGLDYGQIAKSYIGVGAAARVAGGGGLYKDNAGRADIIGLPFV